MTRLRTKSLDPPDDYFCCRKTAQLTIALFVFLVRMYDVREEGFQDGLLLLSGTRVNGQRVTLEYLHDRFYQAFMESCCWE